jgi:3-phenylpropionate/cinnamic acid dioxygenase small subunit
MNVVAKPELKSLDDAIRETIYRACLLLDDEKFMEWLALCAPNISYMCSRRWRS